MHTMISGPNNISLSGARRLRTGYRRVDTSGGCSTSLGGPSVAEVAETVSSVGTVASDVDVLGLGVSYSVC